MTLSMLVRSALECSAIILLLVGFLNEKKVIAFETKLFRAIRIHLRNRRRRKAHEAAMNARRAQKRAPAAEKEASARMTVVRSSGRGCRVA